MIEGNENVSVSAYINVTVSGAVPAGPSTIVTGARLKLKLCAEGTQ